jgi:hypothetical protein
MCSYVETPDIRVIIDPGVSLSKRYNLFPHPKEYQALADNRQKIAFYSKKAEIISISHYHFDHITPTYIDYLWTWSDIKTAEQIYKNKIVFGKDIRAFVNPSQRRRGWMFKKGLKRYVKKFKVADGQTFNFGETKLKFSAPVFHGEKHTSLGWVIMLTIEFEDESFFYASDVQGPILHETLTKILSTKPNIVIIGGPPLYLSGIRVTEKTINLAIDNLIELVKKVPTVVLEHHLLRIEKWEDAVKPVYKAAEEVGHKVLTAAEFSDKNNYILEFKRKELYDERPPTKDFLTWLRLPEYKKKIIKPPL